ncbi:MAG TPA: RidA family protein [Gammaproteobacteria bacterium]|jgi:2-iminobutanoate/2-iminopropanoate deaminase|nr:RidA family protein [Gammaproteobacteria bacterium]HIL18205.1 RidA family protein [Gammaproteobacteria bacterium]
MIDRIQPVSIPKSTAPFSQVVLDDWYVYFSGLVAADFPEGLAVLGDVAAETTAILNVISKVLKELGLEMCDIVKAEVHLTDLADFDAMDEAYRQCFPPNTTPARTTTESKHLFGDSRVEITVQARRR